MKPLVKFIKEKRKIHHEKVINGKFEYWHICQALFMASITTGDLIDKQDIEKVNQFHRLYCEKGAIKRVTDFFNDFIERYSFLFKNFNDMWKAYQNDHPQDISDYPDDVIGEIVYDI